MDRLPTDDELQRMAEHFGYEVREYRKAIVKLQQDLKGKPEWNPTLESALLHFRILRSFFLSTRHKLDVIAGDYIPDWKPTSDAVFDATRDDIDQRLAHLSMGRLNEAFNWPLDDMDIAIEKLVSEFRKRLPPERSEWFANLDSQTIPVRATLGSMPCRTDSGSPRLE